ncbi:hypothetical protein ACW186_11210 [Limosilactobacillus fermentum]
MGVNFRTGNPIWVYYTDVDTGINLRVPTLLKGMAGLPANRNHQPRPLVPD